MKPIWAIIAVALFGSLAFLGGRCSKQCLGLIVESRIDTVVRIDTIRDTVLIPVERQIVRVETDTLRVAGDTVFVAVEVPITKTLYQTDEYRAEIEGFRASLLSMEVYRSTAYVNRTNVIKTPDTRRWGIGIQVGYGATLRDGRIVGAPFFGVGMQYNLVKW